MKKAKSRKLKQHKKLAKIINEILNEEMRFRNALQATREKHYPKLATGGIVYGSSNELIKGGEMVVPIVSKGGYMNDNDQYMFQND